MKKIRIFISSPGDVQLERNIARGVIEEFNSLYAQSAKLEVLMWEDFPLSADATFQDGINYFITNEPIDIAVFILWSRLGTPLCKHFVKADGTPYKSGTEYEFDLMMRLHNDKGAPSRILTYVKKSDQAPEVCNLQELEEFVSQKRSVNAFISEYFRDDETNSNYAYMPFGEAASFEDRFRTHLRNAIRDIIGESVDVKEWEGNPYVGLSSFEFNQQAIFFGRKQLIYETASKLNTWEGESNYKKSLIVLGESGSGKSSFVKAGLLPIFCNKNNSSQYSIVHPSMYGGYMYHGMVDLLVQHFPFLNNHPFIDDLRKGISAETNFNYLSYAFEQNSCNDVIIYIDQFEELFSDNRITEEERERVILLLKGLVAMRPIAVFISLRSDFYNRFSMYEAMAQIKELCEVVDLPVMGPSEIAEIIEAPARKACLKWEIDSRGVELNRRIIKDASSIKDLPLIEFALSELYESRSEGDMMTWEAYDKMGGLKGAIINYANRCYSQLSEEEKKAFDDILGFIVTESASHKGTYVRKTSLKEDVEKSPIHAIVVDKLLDARLLVSDKDNHGRATITITHEILLRSWDVVVKWIEGEKEFIASNRHYEQLAQHWVNGGRHKKDLIKGRSQLMEAEYFHYKNHSRVSDNVLKFVESSFVKTSKGGLVWRTIALAASVLGALFILVEYLTELFDLGIDTLEHMWLLAAVAVLLLNSVIVYAAGKPKYKTVGRTIFAASVSFLLFTVFCIFPYSMFNLSGMLITLLPITTYLVIEICELYRRKRWNNGYKSPRMSDETATALRSVAWTALMVGIWSLGYAGMLESEKDRFESLAERYADPLFNAMDNMQYELSNSDNIFLNAMRVEYLRENFYDDIMDEQWDERELQYARSLYNLKNPESAIRFLYPNDTWTDHLYYIICSWAIGDYDYAGEVLDWYAEEKRYDEISNTITTKNLIWIAEMAGHFESAAVLDSIVVSNVEITAQENVEMSINRGHIYLANEDITGAIDCYSNAFASAMEHFANDPEADVRQFVLDEIGNDYHLLSRFGALPDDLLQQVADMMGVEFSPAYVPISAVDSVETENIFEKLIGNWEYEGYDSDGDAISIELNISEDFRLCTYYMYDSEEEEFNRFLTEPRFGMVDGKLLWDEYDSYNNQNYLYEIVEIGEDSFTLNSEGDGLQTYTRMK